MPDVSAALSSRALERWLIVRLEADPGAAMVASADAAGPSAYEMNGAAVHELITEDALL